MKNSTLLFRSLAVIILIAGSAHIVSYASQASEGYQAEITADENLISELPAEDYEVAKNNQNDLITDNYNEETDYIIGNWKVDYDSNEFKGAIVYTIKKEYTVFNAYTIRYEDGKGNSEKAEGSKTLTIKSFDGYKGKGVYKMEYEQQTYNVKCQIDMVDKNTFKLSYDFYGYGDVETWKRQ